MATKRRTPWLSEEIANFLASCPSREQLLSYHPSLPVQERARELLEKSKSGRITVDEQWELDQFEHAEMLVQLIKANLRDKQSCQFNHRAARGSPTAREL